MLYEVITLGELYDTLHDLAIRDPLTGTYNRALLEDRLNQLIASHRRTQATAAVLLLDMVRFKYVNDMLRITSYNVCYTKLLREGAQPRQPLLQGRGGRIDVQAEGFVEIVLAGESPEALLREVHSRYLPDKFVAQIDQADLLDLAKLPAMVSYNFV